MSKNALAFFRNTLTLGQDVPSLFGGERFRALPLGAFLRLESDGRVSAGHHQTPPSHVSIDLAAIIEREALEGAVSATLPSQNPATSFLVKSQRQRVIQGADRLPSAKALCEVFADHLEISLRESQKKAGPKVVVRPARYRSTPTGTLLFDILSERGFEEIDAEAALEDFVDGPVLVVDGLTLYKSDALFSERLCANGQAAALALGLAPHVAKRMVELAGAEEVWQSGYSDFARAIVVQSLERVLYHGVNKGAPFVIGGARAPVFTALPKAENLLGKNIQQELQRVREQGEENSRIEVLLNALQKKRDGLLQAATRLLSFEVTATFPKTAGMDWFERQDSFNAFLADDFSLLQLHENTPGAKLALNTGAKLIPARWFRGAESEPTSRTRSAEVQVPAPLIDAQETKVLKSESLVGDGPKVHAAPIVIGDEKSPEPAAPKALAPSEPLLKSAPESKTSPAVDTPNANTVQAPAPVGPGQVEAPTPVETPTTQSQTPAEDGRTFLGRIDAARLSDPRVVQLPVPPDVRTLKVSVDDVQLDDAYRVLEPLFADGGAILRVNLPQLKSSSVVFFEYDRFKKEHS